MLNKNLVEQVKSALDMAQNSDTAELAERLNICKLVLGTYELSESDSTYLSSLTADDFFEFYSRWLYRIPDKIVPSGSGLILSLSKMLEKMDNLRNEKGMTQEHLDKVRKELEDKREQLRVWDGIKLEIDQSNNEILELERQLVTVNENIIDLEKLKTELSELVELVNTKNDFLSAENPTEVSSEISRYKEILKTQELTLDMAINIARLFSKAEIFGKINLDLLCEYAEDKRICEEIKKSKLVQSDLLSRLGGYEAQIDRVLSEYLNLLKEIIIGL